MYLTKKQSCLLQFRGYVCNGSNVGVSFREIHHTTEYAACGVRHPCRARSVRGDGEWNEHSGTSAAP